MARQAEIKRKTKETDIELKFNIDGNGKYEIDTGIPFLTHMLELFAQHGVFDLAIKASGDLNVDLHHTVEDIGIVLGQTFKKALGDKKAIKRYSSVSLPMDEALAEISLDISGRAYLNYKVDLPYESIGDFEIILVEEFLNAFVRESGLTLHIRQIKGSNTHHIIEAIFKGLAKALDEATQIDKRIADVPSTKGRI